MQTTTTNCDMCGNKIEEQETAPISITTPDNRTLELGFYLRYPEGAIAGSLTAAASYNVHICTECGCKAAANAIK